MPELEPDSGSVFPFTISMLLVGALLAAAAAHEAAALTAFAAATLIVSLAVRAWGLAALLRLEATLTVSQDRLFPGDVLVLSTLLSNRKPLPVWVRLELPRPDALEPVDGGVGKDSQERRVSGETSLLSNESLSGSWSFRALRRGVYRLGPATLSAGDILGLARKEKAFPFPGDIVVFPKIVPIRPLDLPFRDYFGIHPSRGIIEDPAWYEGTREYTGNRPARNIHWKASARLGILQEKIFEPTSHKKVFFLLALGGFEAAEDAAGFEAALELAASMIRNLAEEGASFAVATDRLVRGFPAALPLGRGPEHLGDALELLARCAIETGQPIPPLLSSVGASGAGYVVIGRSPEDGMGKPRELPASGRERALFVFSEGAPADGITGCPALSFGDLFDAGGAVDAGGAGEADESVAISRVAGSHPPRASR